MFIFLNIGILAVHSRGAAIPCGALLYERLLYSCFSQHETNLFKGCSRGSLVLSGEEGVRE
jgi:hypothetical protein